tara:strand:+ start:991 stop:2301 length:1311 start_codon:yes stop_codon:yes gene_type:complete
MPTPNTADAMKRHKAGKAGFTDKAHLKAKGLIPRADGTKRKSDKYKEDLAKYGALLTKEDLDKDDVSTVKPIIKQLKKSVVKHAAQAKQLTKDIADSYEKGRGPTGIAFSIKKGHPDAENPNTRKKYPERQTPQYKAQWNKNNPKDIADDMDRQPQDKDVKKVKGTQPKKYYKTLDKDTKKKRADFFKKKAGSYKKSDGNKDYKAAPGDAKAKTKTSTHTQKYKQMYGEKYDSDKFFDGKGTPEQRLQLLKLTNKALKAFPSSPKQKEIRKEIDALRKKMGMNEDAPANATGTAVVGTGDDSSTVVIKKKDKETMKDRLLKRFKIKETIDRTVPNLEIPEDEIKEKVKHLKAMAMQEADLEEAIKGLQNKAKKTGMPYSILKKVYDRGMAAWKGGHRPGATQQQWAFARVNSFVTKSSGTWGKADKDLADKVRGSK